MNFLAKIENFINVILIKLGEWLWKIIPEPMKKLCLAFGKKYDALQTFFKQLPQKVLNLVLKLVAYAKTSLFTDAKNALSETYKNAFAQYKGKKPEGFDKFKRLFLTPFLMMGQWLSGLSPGQILLLLTFSGGSVLAVIGIGFSGNKLVSGNFDIGRGPASVEEVKFERPVYYKSQTRHLEVTNLRLPVYQAKVNEIRSVDIDFIATMSNRNAKVFLEKHEFQLRDHLILQIEPMVATFPLEEEGKEIIRKKIENDINEFLIQNDVDGKVVQIKITYMLAN